MARRSRRRKPPKRTTAEFGKVKSLSRASEVISFDSFVEPMHHALVGARRTNFASDVSMYRDRALRYQRSHAPTDDGASTIPACGTLCTYLDPASLINLSRTCRGLKDVYKNALAKEWNITRALSLYFQQPALLRDVLRESNAIIFGAFASCFLNRECRPVHMHIAVCDGQNLAQHLVQVEGYTRVTLNGPLEYERGTSHMWHFSKTKRQLDGSTILLRVSLVQTQPGVHPFGTVLEKMPTTAQLNIVTADHAFSVFPDWTFHHGQSYWLKNVFGTTTESSHTEDGTLVGTRLEQLSFADYGSDMPKPNPYDRDRSSLMRTSHIRRVGDRKTWTINFEDARLMDNLNIQTCSFHVTRSIGSSLSLSLDYRTTEELSLLSPNVNKGSEIVSLQYRAGGDPLSSKSSGASRWRSKQLQIPWPTQETTTIASGLTNWTSQPLVSGINSQTSPVDSGNTATLQSVSTRATGPDTSVANFDDDADESFVSVAEDFLAPPHTTTEHVSSEWRERVEDTERVIKEMRKNLPSVSSAETDRYKQAIFYHELFLALARVNIEITICATGQHASNDPQAVLKQPRRRVIRSWLTESIRRLESPHQRDLAPENLFEQVSNRFLASIVVSHANSIFEGRDMPSRPEIILMFDEKNPQNFSKRTNDLGAFLTTRTGIDIKEPHAISRVLKHLESTLGSGPLESGGSMAIVRPSQDATVRNELSMHSSSVSRIEPPPPDSRPYELRGLQSEMSSESERSSPSCYSQDIDLVLLANYDAQAPERSLKEKPVKGLKQPSAGVVMKEYLESAASECLSRSAGDFDPHGTSTPDDNRDQIQQQHNNNDDYDRTRPLLDFERLPRQRQYEVVGPEFFDNLSELDIPYYSVDEDPQPTEMWPQEDVMQAEAQTFRLLNNAEGHNVDRVNSRDLFSMTPEPMLSSAFSDLGKTVAATDQRPTEQTLAAKVALPSGLAKARTHADTPMQDADSVHDNSIVLPDTMSGVRRAKPRKSEPIVLITTPRRAMIPDINFVTDDEDENRRHAIESDPRFLGALERSAAKTPVSRRLPSGTPSSATPRLPPHLAPTRRAAHRKSLDPSSGLATPEEKRIHDELEYPVVDILDEKVIAGVRKYLIKWHPINGRAFENTWEPVENANAEAVRDWGLVKWRKNGSKGKPPKLSDELRAKRREQKEEARLERLAQKKDKPRVGPNRGGEQLKQDGMKSIRTQKRAEAEARRVRNQARRQRKQERRQLQAQNEQTAASTIPSHAESSHASASC